MASKFFVKSHITPGISRFTRSLNLNQNSCRSLPALCSCTKRDYHQYYTHHLRKRSHQFQSEPCFCIQQQKENDNEFFPILQSSNLHTLASKEDFKKHYRQLHIMHAWNNKAQANKTTHNKIKYSIVPRVKSDTISKFLTTHYHQHEPMTKALEMPISEITGWFKRFIRMSMYSSLQDVSVEAVDGKDRRRVGVLCSVVFDPTRSRPVFHHYLDPVEQPVNMEMEEFYMKLEEGVNPTEIVGVTKVGKKPPKILEHLYISIHPDYGGRGIGDRMIALAESLAVNCNGCRVGYVVATSEFSYKIMLKHGYKVVKEIKYADYVNSKGERIFEGKEHLLTPHTSVRAMVKEISDLYGSSA